MFVMTRFPRLYDVRSRVRAARTTIGRLLPRNNSVEVTPATVAAFIVGSRLLGNRRCKPPWRASRLGSRRRARSSARPRRDPRGRAGAGSGRGSGPRRRSRHGRPASPRRRGSGSGGPPRGLVEATGPGEALVGSVLVDGAQVVHHVAAADDEHVLVPQLSESPTELE